VRHAVVAGATGLVGGELLTLLLADDAFERVSVLGRRAADAKHAKLRQYLVDLGEPQWGAADLGGVSHVFCALGTTIKVAGSQEAFRRVDHDMAVNAGRIALQNGAAHYLLVSALGANAKSRVFYNRVKGETENDIIALGYRSVTIVRPSLLLGERHEHRRGEEIAKKLGWLLPPKYRGIEARTVARALVALAKEDRPGVQIIESRGMNVH
jgi:uncharacterized protein YbjT (DUF2867 family)